MPLRAGEAQPVGHHLGSGWLQLEAGLAASGEGARPLDESELYCLPAGLELEHLLSWDVDFLSVHLAFALD